MAGEMVIKTPQSSNIKEVHYEDGNLYVTFNMGGIYKYSNVPYEVFARFQTEPSAGKYFWRAIRSNYAYKKIADGFGG